MGTLAVGERVWLVASGDEHHPPVGTPGTVHGVNPRRTFVDDSATVTVDWDDGTESTVSRWNGVIARPGT